MAMYHISINKGSKGGADEHARYINARAVSRPSFTVRRSLVGAQIFRLGAPRIQRLLARV